MRTVAFLLLLSLASTFLAGCFRTGVAVGPNGAAGRVGVPISL